MYLLNIPPCQKKVTSSAKPSLIARAVGDSGMVSIAVLGCWSPWPCDDCLPVRIPHEANSSLWWTQGSLQGGSYFIATGSGVLAVQLSKPCKPRGASASTRGPGVASAHIIQGQLLRGQSPCQKAAAGARERQGSQGTATLLGSPGPRGPTGALPGQHHSSTLPVLLLPSPSRIPNTQLEPGTLSQPLLLRTPPVTP